MIDYSLEPYLKVPHRRRIVGLELTQPLTEKLVGFWSVQAATHHGGQHFIEITMNVAVLEVLAAADTFADHFTGTAMQLIEAFPIRSGVSECLQHAIEAALTSAVAEHLTGKAQEIDAWEHLEVSVRDINGLSERAFTAVSKLAWSRVGEFLYSDAFNCARQFEDADAVRMQQIA